MVDKLPGIVNYLISLGGLTYILFVFKRRSLNHPDYSLLGYPIKTIITITYIGISINIVLMIGVLFEWIK